MKKSLWLILTFSALAPVAPPSASELFTIQLAQADELLNQNLIKASLKGDLEEVQSVVQQGANVNSTNLQGVTPLMVAALGGHTDVCRFLISGKHSKTEVGADVNVQDSFGMTALMAAARQGHVDVVKLLLTSGADSKIKAKNGKTAADYASAGNHSNIILILAKGGK